MANLCRFSGKGGHTLPSALLQVSLDRAFRPGRGRLGILPRLTESPTLPEQVPEPVERHLELGPSGLLFIGETLTDVPFLELLFLVGQLSDAVDDLLVLHAFPFSSGPTRCASLGSDPLRLAHNNDCQAFACPPLASLGLARSLAPPHEQRPRRVPAGPLSEMRLVRRYVIVMALAAVYVPASAPVWVRVMLTVVAGAPLATDRCKV